MTVNDVYDLVIGRFYTLYGNATQGDNEKTEAAFLKEYEEAFENCSREDLVRGMNEVVRTNEFRMWPTIGLLNKAIDKTRPYRPPANPPLEPEIVRTPEQAKRAHELAAKLREQVAHQAQVIAVPPSQDGEPAEPYRLPAHEYFAAGERRLYERTRVANRLELEALATGKFPPPQKQVAESE